MLLSARTPLLGVWTDIFYSALGLKLKLNFPLKYFYNQLNDFLNDILIATPFC